MKKRVLVVSDNFPPHDRGGAERIAYYQAIALAKAGFDVHVATGSPDGQAQVEFMDGFTVHRLARAQHVPSGPFALVQRLAWLPRAWINPLWLAHLARLCTGLRPDIMHAHFISAISYGAFVGSSRGAAARVVTFHGYQFECPRGGLYKKRGAICEGPRLYCKLHQAILHRELAGVDRIIAISHFIEQRLLAAGYSRDQVVYLPNGVPGVSGRTPPPFAATKQVLFVGRLEANKGVDTLISAFRALADRAASLVVVGDGCDRRRLEDCARGDTRIHFFGWVPHSELASVYQSAHVVVVPSLWHEVMNTVICEAQAWARPVIATPLGGNTDLIEDGKSGFFFSPKDVPGLQRVLESVLEDTALALRIGVNGFSKVQEVSLEMHVDRLLQLYLDIA